MLLLVTLINSKLSHKSKNIFHLEHGRREFKGFLSLKIFFLNKLVKCIKVRLKFLNIIVNSIYTVDLSCFCSKKDQLLKLFLTIPKLSS